MKNVREAAGFMKQNKMEK